MADEPKITAAFLAKEFGGVQKPLQVLKTAKGYYIGTADEGVPVKRESAEYFLNERAAQVALDGVTPWTQRLAL